MYSVEDIMHRYAGDIAIICAEWMSGTLGEFDIGYLEQLGNDSIAVVAGFEDGCLIHQMLIEDKLVSTSVIDLREAIL